MSRVLEQACISVVMTPGYSRRHFLKAAGGARVQACCCHCGTLSQRRVDVTKAFPDELLSIEGYTQGKNKKPATRSAPRTSSTSRICWSRSATKQIVKGGRGTAASLKWWKTTTDVMKLSPWDYIEATLRNSGKGRFDAKGNVVTADGQPWIGGNPFPDAKTGIELFAAQTLSWGTPRRFVFMRAEFQRSILMGDVKFRYDAGWAEMSPVARRVDDGSQAVLAGAEGTSCVFQSVFFLTPQNFRGHVVPQYLGLRPEHVFPLLYGYVAEFRRIRQFPTDQRFRGRWCRARRLYLSDAWAAGDPLNTWGNYKIVGARGRFLAGVSGRLESGSSQLGAQDPRRSPRAPCSGTRMSSWCRKRSSSRLSR